MRKNLILVLLVGLATSSLSYAKVSTRRSQSSSCPGCTYESSTTKPSKKSVSQESTSSVKQKPGVIDHSAGQPGTLGSPSMTSTAESQTLMKGVLRKDTLSIKPQVGLMAYTDQYGNSTSRAAYGLTFESNLATVFNDTWKDVYLGPQVGFIFSHLGESTSNFFGSNPDVRVGSGGANLFIIPVNVKAGYNVTEWLRLAAHGGGNIMYRSVASSFNAGGNVLSNDSIWRIFPNVGADAEIDLGNNAAIMIRPDVTLTPGNSLFTGTVALNIPLS